MGSKKDSLGLESQIKINSFQDSTKIKKASENSLVGSPLKAKIDERKSNTKLKKDSKAPPIIVP